MVEIANFVRDLGVPISGVIALSIVLYKIGTVCGSLLIESWQAKDTRLSELENLVNQVRNGQRESLEKRLDESNATLAAVGASLDRLGERFRHFASNRPCIHDSDVDLVDGQAPREKTLRRIARREERQQAANE